MPLSIFKKIQSSSVRDTTIRFRWDDWNVEQAEEPIDGEFAKRLQGISQRAVISFTIGTAEWIVHRFSALSGDVLPYNYIEVAWAQLVNWGYARITWEALTAAQQWTGPVRGPLGIAMTRIMYAIQQAEEDEDPELRAAWITNLAEYVMTDPADYQKWREHVMVRLETLYPRISKETLGEAIPREAIDLDFDFHVEQSEDLINRFLAGLNYKSNPFLSSPEDMLAGGFEGKPYVFNSEQDRKARFEW